MDEPFLTVSAVIKVAKALPQPFKSSDVAVGLAKYDSKYADLRSAKGTLSGCLARLVRQRELFSVGKEGRSRVYSFDRADAKAHAEHSHSEVSQPLNGGPVRLEVPRIWPAHLACMTFSVDGVTYEVRQRR